MSDRDVITIDLEWLTASLKAAELRLTELTRGGRDAAPSLSPVTLGL